MRRQQQPGCVVLPAEPLGPPPLSPRRAARASSVRPPAALSLLQDSRGRHQVRPRLLPSRQRRRPTPTQAPATQRLLQTAGPRPPDAGAGQLPQLLFHVDISPVFPERGNASV